MSPKKFFLISLSLLCFLFNPLAHANKGKGKALYKLCIKCHGKQGEGNFSLEAPAIAAMPSWYLFNQLKKFKDGGRGLHPKHWPGIRMRSMARTIRTEEDMKAVSDYVEKLPPAKLQVLNQGGDLMNGKEIYHKGKLSNGVTACITCHGPKANGMKAVNAPPLTLTNDWYLKSQLFNFKHGIRGANPVKDPIGMSMAVMVKGLDEKSLTDVIAYIQYLRLSQKDK